MHENELFTELDLARRVIVCTHTNYVKVGVHLGRHERHMVLLSASASVACLLALAVASHYASGVAAAGEAEMFGSGSSFLTRPGLKRDGFMCFAGWGKIWCVGDSASNKLVTSSMDTGGSTFVWTDEVALSTLEAAFPMEGTSFAGLTQGRLIVCEACSDSAQAVPSRRVWIADIRSENASPHNGGSSSSGGGSSSSGGSFEMAAGFPPAGAPAKPRAWQLLPELPQALTYASLVAMPCGAVMVVGGLSGSPALARTPSTPYRSLA
jgi:hypothetical protein